MASSITRRQALQLLLGAPWALHACQRRPSLPPGELLGPAMERGHLLRQPPPKPAAHAWRKVPTVIVGAGVAGLSAAWCLRRAGWVPGRDFVLLELEDAPGGTARGGRSATTAYPWGAHYVPAPLGDNAPLVALLGEMDVLDGTDAFGEPQIQEARLCHDPQERLFHLGRWQEGLYPRAGATPGDLAQLQAFHRHIDTWVGYRDARGRRAFTIPVAHCSDAPECRALDGITAHQWLMDNGLTSPRLHWLVDYACRDDYGGTLHSTSAWAALFYFTARVARPGVEAQPLLTWPEGNQRLVRHLARHMGEALCPGTVALDVDPHATGVRVTGVQGDAAVGWDAQRVIVAAPHFVVRHLLRPWRASPPPNPFEYSAWVVANLHLRGRPKEPHTPLAWDNVLHHSPSLGYVAATHQSDRHSGPTVFTYYYPLASQHGPVARQLLLGLDQPHWAEVVLTDLQRAHPDLPALVERLDVWRWGHAMVRPQPGLLAGAQRQEAAAPYRGVHFAHTDLSGMALFEEAFYHGVRAAQEVLQAREWPALRWT